MKVLLETLTPKPMGGGRRLCSNAIDFYLLQMPLWRNKIQKIMLYSHSEHIVVWVGKIADRL